MNEPLFAHRIRHALDESADRLPYRVTQRLARSRELALARMPQVPASGEHTSVRRADRSPVNAAATGLRPSGDPGLSPWMRLAGGAIPVLAVLVGLYGIGTWHTIEAARETAEIDVALLTDDLPIDAYADRGFGVFIRNSRQ